MKIYACKKAIIHSKNVTAKTTNNGMPPITAKIDDDINIAQEKLKRIFNNV